MSRTARGARRRPGLVPAVAAVLCLLAVSAMPLLAWAVESQDVESPAADEVVTGPFDVVVSVVESEGEVVQAVSARLIGPSERFVELARGDGDRWTGRVVPLEGLAMANGRYTVEVTADPLLGDPETTADHAVHLQVPPPRRALTAGPAADDPTRVQLSWQPATLPDFLAYRVQRRPDADGGTWTTVAEVDDPRGGEAVDVVPAAGAYRYRLIVVREDGQGGELFATSAARGVRADPADPGTFAPPPEPEPRPANTTPPDVAGPITRPDDDPPGATPGPPETQTAGGGTPTSGPRVTIRPPSTGGGAAPAPPAPVPAPVPLDDGVFETELPLSATETELEVVETDTALLRGGVTEGGDLNIFTEDTERRPVMTAIAGGLLLLVTAGHVSRFLAGGSKR